MIPVRIVGLALDTKSQPVVILKPIGEEPGEGKMLPIWIGGQEATSILMAVEGTPPPRPLTLDLMRTMLENLGAEVERVEITRLEEGTFFAEITVRTPAGLRTFDARPSDSIGLALRTDTQIWVAEAVLEEAGVADETAGAADEEAEVAAFSEFLETVDPEDFQG